VHASSEAYIILGDKVGGGATRCELLKPLLVHDALLRHGKTSIGGEGGRNYYFFIF
jgi:hypothetical protein